MPDGTVLLIGGTDSLHQGVSEIDIFDPSTDTFASLSSTFPLACEVKFAGVVEGKPKEL
jgi:hypothetical protein